ncbi:major facilitator superfamily domain-containing protein [Abortiporus biennis]|nr:major facilitator superfamily domain-containing protein [Abortiporus biennis]
MSSDELKTSEQRTGAENAASSVVETQSNKRPLEEFQTPNDKQRNVTEHNLGSVEPEKVEKPYSAFTLREKWIIVSMAAFGATFSPLTSNIYFPAIPAMADAFHKSTELINLTVTMYMVFQGVAPMFWGTLGDKFGRRPMFIGCMIVLCGACVGIAVMPTSAYWLLMVLRCVQAAGSASTIALGAGVIADIATRAERGSFFGFFLLGPMLGPCIGPVIGGGLAQGLGWRAIFWFLVISSGFCLVVMILFFPETFRAIVGDGSIRPPPLYIPVIPIIGRKRLRDTEDSEVDRPPFPKFKNPFLLFLYPDITILLLFNGVVNAVFYGVVASISSLFNDIYPYLNETSIGLVFLAYGGGMFVGSAVTGKVLDKEYQSIKIKAIQAAEKASGIPGSVKPEDITKDDNFPIEVARFRTMPYYLFVFTGCCVGYGWCLQQRVNIAGPLVLHILMGYTTIAILNTTQTLIVDLLPNQGSSITACNNLVRCGLGAALVSVIQLMINAINVGWTYVVFGGMLIAISPMMFVIMRMGPKFRAKRRAHEIAKSLKAEAEAAAISQK